MRYEYRTVVYKNQRQAQRGIYRMSKAFWQAVHIQPEPGKPSGCLALLLPGRRQQAVLVQFRRRRGLL